MSDTAWKFTFNAAGCKPIDPHGFVRPTEGAYKVEIKEVSRGEKSIKINGVLLEAFEGAKFWANVGTDMEKKYNRDHLYTALLSKGVKAEQLAAAGEVNITAETFMGKVMHIYITPPPPDAQKDEKGRLPFDDVKFITPEQYAEFKKAAKSGKPANGASAPAGMGKIADAVGGAPTAAAGAVDI